MLWVEEESRGMRDASSGMGWSPRWFSDKVDEGERLGSWDWIERVVERGQRDGGREGRCLASRWRGEGFPLARGVRGVS